MTSGEIGRVTSSDGTSIAFERGGTEDVPAFVELESGGPHPEPAKW
jgi:hypothetical protein